MPDGRPEELSAFGLENGPASADDPFLHPEDAPETPPAPEAVAPEAPAPQSEPQTEPEPAVEGEQTEPTEKLLAGKYRTVEDLEKGYSEARALQMRTAQAVSAYEQRVAQYEEAIKRIIPVLQQQQRPAPAADDPIVKEAQAAGLDDEAIKVAQAIAAREADSRFQVLQQQLQQFQMNATQQAQAQRAEAEARAAVGSFFQTHQDVQPGSSEDIELMAVIQELNLDYSNRDSLEVALEAVRSPELRKVLRVNPHYIDSDEGMEMARIEASVLRASTAPSTPPDRADALKRAYTERGGTGAPPASPADNRPLDPWEEVKQLAQREGAASAFGI